MLKHATCTQRTWDQGVGVGGLGATPLAGSGMFSTVEKNFFSAGN